MFRSIVQPWAKHICRNIIRAALANRAHDSQHLESVSSKTPRLITPIWDRLGHTSTRLIQKSWKARVQHLCVFVFSVCFKRCSKLQRHPNSYKPIWDQIDHASTKLQHCSDLWAERREWDNLTHFQGLFDSGPPRKVSAKHQISRRPFEIGSNKPAEHFAQLNVDIVSGLRYL